MSHVIYWGRDFVDRGTDGCHGGSCKELDGAGS